MLLDEDGNMEIKLVSSGLSKKLAAILPYEDDLMSARARRPTPLDGLDANR